MCVCGEEKEKTRHLLRKRNRPVSRESRASKTKYMNKFYILVLYSLGKHTALAGK